jgi:hypothetical protein
MVSLVPAVLLLVLAATVLATRSDGGGGGDDRHDDAAAERSAAASATEAGADPASTAAATGPTGADDRHFVCPDGGIDAVRELEQAWEDGHQPWLGSAPDVAAACTFGGAESSVEPVGSDRYRVTHTTAADGESAIVQLAQPLGPDTVWAAVEITYSTSGTPQASCTEAAILPVVADALEGAAGGALHIVSVDVRQCRNGYARVFAVPDDSGCEQPGGACMETEQVFLTDDGGEWSYLTSGTGIACGADDDLFPELLAACRGLGLRP